MSVNPKGVLESQYRYTIKWISNLRGEKTLKCGIQQMIAKNYCFYRRELFSDSLHTDNDKYTALSS